MIKHLIPVMMRVYFTEWVHYILHGAVIYAATEDWISHSNAGRNTIQPLEDVWRKVQEGAPSMRNLLGNAQLNGFRCGKHRVPPSLRTLVDLARTFTNDSKILASHR